MKPVKDEINHPSLEMKDLLDDLVGPKVEWTVYREVEHPTWNEVRRRVWRLMLDQIGRPR